MSQLWLLGHKHRQHILYALWFISRCWLFLEFHIFIHQNCYSCCVPRPVAFAPSNWHVSPTLPHISPSICGRSARRPRRRTCVRASDDRPCRVLPSDASRSHPYENPEQAGSLPDLGYGCKMVDGVMHVYTERNVMEKWVFKKREEERWLPLLPHSERFEGSQDWPVFVSRQRVLPACARLLKRHSNFPPQCRNMQVKWSRKSKSSVGVSFLWLSESESTSCNREVDSVFSHDLD